MILDDEIIYCTKYVASQLHPADRNFPFRDDEDSSYLTICDLLGEMLFCGRCTGVDRTGTISNRFKYRVLTSIPKIPPIFTKSFKDICFERAQEIVDLNKPISIMWSGGIDSTGVLTTLMQIALPKQITVLFEPRSLIEYPWFFENHIKGKLKYKILDQHIWRYERNPNEILVTGQNGDQLFTNSAILDNFKFKDLPWIDIFDQPSLFYERAPHEAVDQIRSMFEKQSVRNHIRNNVQSFLDKSPFEIKTAFDFYWWVNFAIKWQAVEMRPNSLNSTITAEKHLSLYNFYNSTDFQLWSMVNHDLKVKDTKESYKYVIKDMIYNFTGDADYRDYKLKESSGPTKFSDDIEVNNPEIIKETIESGKVPSMVDASFNNFTYRELLDNRADFEKIMNPIPDALLNQEVACDENWINLNAMT
jgi:hypothetical protein